MLEIILNNWSSSRVIFKRIRSNSKVSPGRQISDRMFVSACDGQVRNASFREEAEEWVI